MPEPLTDAELEMYRAAGDGIETTQRMLATIDALKEEVEQLEGNYSTKDTLEIGIHIAQMELRVETAEARLDKVRELPEKIRNAWIAPGMPHSGAIRETLKRAAYELQAVLDE